MSLLMDALRKAEQQKQRLAEQAPPAAAAGASPALELEPLQPPASSAPPAVSATPDAPAAQTHQGRMREDSLPELPARLEDLDDQFMTEGPRPINVRKNAPEPRLEPPREQPAAEPTGENAEQTARATARKVFESKQVPQRDVSFAIAVGLVTLVAAVGIGGYFWWELQPKGGLGPTPAAPLAAIPPAPIRSPAPVAAAAPSSSLMTAVTEPAGAPQQPIARAEPTYQAMAAAAAPAPRQAAGKTEPRDDAPQSPIRIATAPQKINPLLEQAWQAFNRNELDFALASWQKVLGTDPRNADALHGLAAIAQKQGKADEAASLYLRALEVDPKDALALSGLVALRVPADTQLTESRLKQLLAEQPDSPYLNFALGNHYSRSMRWAEAQQAYFKAHAAEPANPDYLFNLAVSLDQLHQLRLAMQYYNRALAAAERRQPGFDAAQVAARLKVLQSEPQR